MKKSTLSGFTLIELMIVIAIIGVLAMFAVPSYQAYVIRAMATDAMSLAEQAKTAVMEYYLNTGKFPENNADAGLAEPEEINTNYVAQVAVAENGNIIISFRAQGIPEPIRDATWEFTPELNNGQITWSCNNGSLDLKYRPTICRSDQG